MQKIKLIVTLLIFPLCFTSCFQIIEEMNLKNDGSGDMTLTLNLSQSKTKVASLMLLDSVGGYKVPSKADVVKKMNETLDYLKKSEGISNVRKTIDWDNYIFTISFSFKNMANVNGLTENLVKTAGVQNVGSLSFVYINNLFMRTYVYSPSVKNEYNKLNKDAKDIFNSATYTNICRFEKEISNYSNKSFTTSKSGKAVMLKSPILDLINGKTNISNTIQLSK